MARFLDSMKKAEEVNRLLPTTVETRADPPSDPPFTLHVAPLPVGDQVDDEAVMPFIEVGPSRSIEASPEVLAQPSGISTRFAIVSEPSRSVTFRPLPGTVATPIGIAAEIIAFHDAGHRISGQYRELLKQIVAATRNATAPALLFTGSAANAGTTTVVLNLAVTAARQGHRVVVMDVNTRRPAIAARLALCDRPGVGEVLAGIATLDEAIQDSKQPGLAALTSGGPGVPAPRGAECYRSLLRLLRQRFDLILVDAPRWEGRSEVTAPASACDASFLVLPAGTEDSPAAHELVRNIPTNGIALVGTIVAAR
jgi:Mrp family chromosome partitioning ATPase